MGSGESWAQRLAVAELEEEAIAVERLAAAYAELERRRARFDAHETEVPAAVSVGQLRLVVGG